MTLFSEKDDVVEVGDVRSIKEFSSMYKSKVLVSG